MPDSPRAIIRGLRIALELPPPPPALKISAHFVQKSRGYSIIEFGIDHISLEPLPLSSKVRLPLVKARRWGVETPMQSNSVEIIGRVACAHVQPVRR